MIRHKISLRVLLFEENKTWIAQCLENDIATQGKSIADAMNALERTIIGQIALDVKNGIKPLSEIAPAPQSCFDKFEKAYLICDKPKFTLPQTILPRPVMAVPAIADSPLAG